MKPCVNCQQNEAEYCSTCIDDSDKNSPFKTKNDEKCQMNFTEKIHIDSTIWVMLLMSGLVYLAMFWVMQPEQQQRAQNYIDEEKWIKTATCPELLDYIRVGLEQEPENSHFFVNSAKELHQWKCEK